MRHSDVVESLVGILSDMTADWGLDLPNGIGPDTRLVAELEFTSVDIIHLIVAIEEQYQRPSMGFQELLIQDNRYVDELSVQQLADFVADKLSGARS
jgi:acyl carrier protein